jgi:hypothetical protein
MSCTSLPFSLSIYFLCLLFFRVTPPSLEVNYCYSTLQYYASWSFSSAECLVFPSWVTNLRQMRLGWLAGLESNPRACWRATHWATPHPRSISYLVMQKAPSDRVYRKPEVEWVEESFMRQFHVERKVSGNRYLLNVYRNEYVLSVCVPDSFQ